MAIKTMGRYKRFPCVGWWRCVLINTFRRKRGKADDIRAGTNSFSDKTQTDARVSAVNKKNNNNNNR